jgi:hypothetical protein
LIDTHRQSPHDFSDPDKAQKVTESEHVVQSHSTVVLVADRSQR